MSKASPLHPATRVGHVHLKVSDLERAVNFYCGVLGFELTQRYSAQAAFVSAGGYHHHIGLNTWESKGGSPPAPGTTGLYHAAFLYPTRASLAEALQRLQAAEIPLDGASDHGVSEALYLRDPDDNGLELYWDRPQAFWPRNESGGIEMFTRPLDLNDLLSELDRPQPPTPPNVETVKELYEAFRARDILKIFSLFSPEMEIYQSSEVPWGGKYKGHDAVRGFFTKLTETISSSLVLERFIDSGSHVTAIGRTQGTINKSGACFDVPFAHVWQLTDGVIERVEFHIDAPTMRQALDQSGGQKR